MLKEKKNKEKKKDMWATKPSSDNDHGVGNGFAAEVSLPQTQEYFIKPPDFVGFAPYPDATISHDRLLYSNFLQLNVNNEDWINYLHDSSLHGTRIEFS